MKFFEELKKRNVYKAGVAYLVTSWLLLQIVDVVGPGLGWDESVTTLLLKILIVGFPIALVLAWLYELTPKGFKRTGTYQEDTADNKKAGRRLNYFIIGVLSVAVCFLLVDKVFISGSNNTDDWQEASIANLPDFTSSIAVLAFDDMSPNKDQEYLSDGISEEILNYLAKYRDLKVISRTSSFAYKGKDVSIAVIGEELGVAYVLEGSVRKAGDTYRITVQLTDTKDESHIWSYTFDRKIEDVLFVQDEIARIVAERLNLTLSNEDVRLRKVDPKAYEINLKAKNALSSPSDSTGIIADSLIRRSLEIDEGYSPSWVLLSDATLLKGIYHRNLPKNEAISIGLKAAKKAIELDSSNINGYLALIDWQWLNRNGNESQNTLNELLANKSHLSSVLSYSAFSFHRMGKTDKALEYAYRARDLDPKSYSIFFKIAFLELYKENYEKALAAIEKGIELRELQIGQRSWGYDVMAWIKYNLGDKKNAYEILKKEPDDYWRNYTKNIFYSKEGRIQEVEEYINDLKKTPIDKLDENSTDLNVDLSLIYCALDNKDSAFEYLNKGIEELLIQPNTLWTFPEFKILHSDPRWAQLIDRLGKELNFDYNSP